MGTLIHTKDIGLFNCIAAEVNRLAGMLAYYYRLRRDISARDPLYQELIDEQWRDLPNGMQLNVFTTNPEHATTTGEEGRRTQWDANIWIARINWEEAVRKADGLTLADAIEPPRIGDVVNAWGEYFDIVDYDKDGILDDMRPIYVLHKVSLRRQTKFEAWRRTQI